jgi:hypothetical protein
MSGVRLSPFLQRALLADALISGATGLLMFLGAGFLTGLLALPEPLLRYAGLALLPFAAFVAFVATRERLNRMLVWDVIILNALWTIGSIVLLVSGWVAPNMLGAAFVIFQAVVVGVFAELQFIGVRRTTSVASA